MNNIGDENVLVVILGKNNKAYYLTNDNEMVEYKGEDKKLTKNAFTPNVSFVDGKLTLKNTSNNVTATLLTEYTDLTMSKVKEVLPYWELQTSDIKSNLMLYDANQQSLVEEAVYEKLYILTDTDFNFSIFGPGILNGKLNKEDPLIVFLPLNEMSTKAVPKNFDGIINNLPPIVAKPIQKLVNDFNLREIGNNMLQPIRDVRDEIRSEVKAAKQMFVMGYVFLLAILIIFGLVIIYLLKKISNK